MGRKCGVEGCLSDSNRQEDLGVTFHKVPNHTDIRPKWMQLCRIPDDKKNYKVIYICSRHFLRADFCNFKGKKYMLRQGVLPSVFPWDKSKLEAIIKSDIIKKEQQQQFELIPSDDNITTTGNVKIKMEEDFDIIKQEITMMEDVQVKLEPPGNNNEEQKAKSVETNFGTVNFAIDSKIEVVDFNSEWHPARIAEIDYEENEVLIHFENDATRNDEWICMDSPRLRPFQIVHQTLPPVSSVLPTTGPTKRRSGKPLETYVLGERCLACWSDARKFPATVTKVLPNDFYEVLFDDGFVKNLKAHRMSKSQGKAMQASPLFDPVQGTKQDRRDKKRKLNVAALFGKRQKLLDGGVDEKVKLATSPVSPPALKTTSGKSAGKGSGPSTILQSTIEFTNKETGDASIIPSSSSNYNMGESPKVDEVQRWIPKWLPNGYPDGIETKIEMSNGKRRSWIVPDPRMPPNWTKHLTQRISGASAGKWDTVIVSPENKTFRTRSDIRNFIKEFPQLNLNEDIFDFNIYRRSRKSLGAAGTPARRRKTTDKKLSTEKPALNDKKSLEKTSISEQMFEPQSAVPQTPIKEEPTSEDSNTPPPNQLKILVIDDAYKCPIEGCGKNFRKENLAQMHVKHYHPEFAKFLDSTPNVSDLAYARTVGESLEGSPGPVRTAPKLKASTPKNTIKTPVPSLIIEPELPPPLLPPTSRSKDSEIIKLLNSKPYSEQNKLELDESVQAPIPGGLPSNMYPDIKLKDLLTKSEGIPKMDDHVLKTLSTTRPTGIKTLLPVRGSTIIEPDPLQALSTTRPSGLKTILPVHQGDIDPKQQLSITRTGIKTLLPVRPAEIEHKQEPDYHKRNHTVKVHTKQGIRRKRIFTEPSELYHLEKQAFNQEENPTQEVTPPHLIEHPTHIIEGGEVIKIVRMKQEEIINCTCGYAEEDGLMIQCELCLCWQHAYCNNIERESQVPDKYVCYICQNPLKQRPSRKYYHDQDWLKLGVLPTTSFHSKDEELLQKRFETLKKSHDVSGALLELKDFMHALKVKMKIAEAKNHPKLYLWSKPWEKLPLPEKMDLKTEDAKHQEDIKTEFGKSNSNEQQNDSMLMMILKDGKEDALIESNQVQAPIIPQPEAAIDSAVCKINLLEHISHSQHLVDERLDDLEKVVFALEEGLDQAEDSKDYPRARETVQMLLRDLNTLQEFSNLSTL